VLAKSSARLAFVNNPTMPANKDVKTMIRETLVQMREFWTRTRLIIAPMRRTDERRWMGERGK
jgi:hypothetical protein